MRSDQRACGAHVPIGSRFVMESASTKAATELRRAVETGDLETCRWLIDAGASADPTDAQGKRYLLHAAVNSGGPEVCRLLLDRGADLHALDKHGNAPLHDAVDNRFVQISRLLLSRGANPNQRNERGETALHLVHMEVSIVKNPREVTLCQLLIDSGASVEAACHKGYAPLHAAVVQENLGTARLLVAAGASSSFAPVDAPSNYLTPFQTAIKEWKVALVDFFLRECGEDVAQRTHSGRTMLQLAGRNQAIKEALRSAKTELAIADAMTVDLVEVPAPKKRSGGPSIL